MGNKKIIIGFISGASIIAIAVAILMFGFGESDNTPYGLNSTGDQSNQVNENPSGTEAQPLEGNDAFPSEILGLSLVQYVDGEEAVASIGQLHGTNVGTKEGYIATYQKQNEEKMITIWISVDPADKAQELFEIMDGKISSNPNVPFTGRKEIEVKDFKVINVQGKMDGQEHFYWVDGERNYWVALGGFENPTEALGTIIDGLKK